MEITDPVGDEIVGQYKWPIASGTYDPDTKTTVLNLDGAIHYKLYCDPDDPELCALDSLFRDLKVIISPDRQIVYGTYIGIPQDDPGGFKQRHEGVLGILNISSVEPNQQGDVTDWSMIPSVAGPELNLYPEGTDIDPVTIHYTGPSGKPFVPEHWDKQGVPLYEKTGDWETKNSGSLVFFPTADNTTLIAMHYEEKDAIGGGPENWDNTSFTAVDAVTMDEIASTKLDHPIRPDGLNIVGRGPVTWDQQTNTMFFFVGGYKRPRMIFATSWDETSKSFDTVEVDKLDMPEGVTLRHHGGVFSWDSNSNRLLLSVETVMRETDDSTVEMWEYRKTDAGWVKSTHPLSLPTGDDAVPERSRIESLTEGHFVEKGCDSWINEQLVCANAVTYTTSNGATKAAPAFVVWQEPDGSWKSRYLPNTIPTDFADSVGNNEYPFGSSEIAADGSLLLGEPPAPVSFPTSMTRWVQPQHKSFCSRKLMSSTTSELP